MLSVNKPNVKTKYYGNIRTCMATKYRNIDLDIALLFTIYLMYLIYNCHAIILGNLDVSHHYHVQLI